MVKRALNYKVVFLNKLLCLWIHFHHKVCAFFPQVFSIFGIYCQSTTVQLNVTVTSSNVKFSGCGTMWNIYYLGSQKFFWFPTTLQNLDFALAGGFTLLLNRTILIICINRSCFMTFEQTGVECSSLVHRWLCNVLNFMLHIPSGLIGLNYIVYQQKYVVVRILFLSSDVFW
jgi:hypothetical protein